ncbi:GntR family transcriptional regulator [Pseudaestuariivita rosea]|uniref:GntR family transcriptional regulator n=1 Tax=Pseudaestuariivita rosea TaxID=2763263 RepID=UPI001F3F957D|nr:GntR family transcriptional regulator [Pseudaestuariivita rosea]
MSRQQSWQSVHDEVLRRINTRIWKPGEQIPNEADLAAEFSCARTTVNRALREIAKTGLLDRRRKAGTRIAEQPVAKATFDIPVMRQEIEEGGQTYNHQLLQREVTAPPDAVSDAIGVKHGKRLLRLKALHLADCRPYAFEDRWVNLEVTPKVNEELFDNISANEWLLQNVPYTHGEISFFAMTASPDAAKILNCDPGSALFTLERLTWNGPIAVTHVRMMFTKDHKMRATL